MINARAEVLYSLELVAVTTTEGVFRFVLGHDGIFTATDGSVWYGASILSGSDDQMMIGDVAPTGSLSVAWMQDPSMPDISGQMKALGLDYVLGLPIRFYVQPLASLEEVFAPAQPYQLYMTRQASGLPFTAEGPARRSITLSYVSVGQGRNHQRRQVYNTADHSALVGASNPSLQFMAQEYIMKEPLVG